jgi:RNA polymerase sigma factor (sigma-70 family)
MAAVPSIGRAARVERTSVPAATVAADLYERYSPQIFSYCVHQLGSREEAEDAVQTTFMNAFRGLQRGIVPELESAWLFKIAHNVCLSRRRSSWRRGRVEAPNNFEVLQEVVPGREQVADELIRLQDVLEEMPENQRRAILLREWQGLTYREISDELGLSQAAVETLIFRARRALAQGLEQDADTWKKRLRRGADAGGAFACAKTLLGGGGAAAMKISATAALVATAALAAAPAKKQPQVHRTARARTTVASPVAARTRRARTSARAVGSAPRTRKSAAKTPGPVAARAHVAARQPTSPPDSSSAVLPAPTGTPIETATVPAQVESTTAPSPPPDNPPTPAPEGQSQPTLADPPTPEPQGAKPDLLSGPEKTKPDHPDHPDHPDNLQGPSPK